jgi:hypothetical protein
MSRNLSRLTLVLDSVAVERVKDITSEAVLREGVNRSAGTSEDEFAQTNTEAFRYVWDHINGKRIGGSVRWEANPWVFVLKFHVKK